MQLNYLGVVASVQCLYPRMVQRNAGHICLISSVMGTMGFAGYSAYAASKYAVKGLADCLRNELQGTNVSISIAFPPDTDTPGYKQENESKPPETREISALSTLFPPNKVAAGIVRGIKRRSYILPTPDIGLNLHADASQGLVPRGFLDTCCAMLTGWITPLVQSIYGLLFDRISRRHAQSRFRDLPSIDKNGSLKKSR
ncbi:hypothetical protein DUNSADRAFT_1792 [Dunaliella salina]|uniref:Uncharacterized protein n=1 Tax=Dunaliella salina TaxID=3046 RepID=A0ABQ7GWP5_DUNSA|nr:hypothetical protein DUNSADRAFT_1792 [Dunaliella salina]|eukprot:KAF5839015.1 hypothetical protein DUNSADRAFT_1792 [Dunaliella salina]